MSNPLHHANVATVHNAMHQTRMPKCGAEMWIRNFRGQKWCPKMRDQNA